MYERRAFGAEAPKARRSWMFPAGATTRGIVAPRMCGYNSSSSVFRSCHCRIHRLQQRRHGHADNVGTAQDDSVSATNLVHKQASARHKETYTYTCI